MKTLGESTREERVAGARALGRVISAGNRLEQAGVSLNTVAALSTIAPGEFAQLCHSMTLDQSTLLRDYLKSLLELAAFDQVGEVVLSSVNTNTIRSVIKDSGLVSYLHDMINVIVSMKKLEANLEARKNAKLSEGLRTLKELEAKFEQNAESMVEQFVA